MRVCKIHACKMHACEMHASEMHASMRYTTVRYTRLGEMHNCEKRIHICIQLRQRPLYTGNWRQRGQCCIFVMRACEYAPMLISVSEIAPSRICVPNMRPCYIPEKPGCLVGKTGPFRCLPSSTFTLSTQPSSSPLFITRDLSTMSGAPYLPP